MTTRSLHGPAQWYLTPRLASRERSHRRLAIVSVAILVPMAILPAAVDHGPQSIEIALAGFDHIGALCVAALHLMLAPVHGGFHLLLGAGLLYAIWDRFRAWRQLNRALAPLDTRVPQFGDRFWNACDAAGVPAAAVRVVRGLPNPAFTVGMVIPRIYVAEELADRVSAEELQAVLAHEGAHLAKRDPLRSSLLRGMTCALFWIPALSRLAEDLRDESEVEADDVAATRAEAVVLASAIVRLAQWGDAGLVPRASVGFQRRELLGRRVRRLLGEDAGITSHVTVSSMSRAVLALSVVWSAGLLMAHPLPGTADVASVETVHCAHHAGGPLSHLFCRRASTDQSDCPHTVELEETAAAAHRH